jgi:tryptophan synthase alpha chain
LIKGGADMLEIGIPFSDPIADGPTIEAAAHSALEKGIRPADGFRLASDLRKKYPEIPLLVMTYSNIVTRKGLDKFMDESRKADIDGFITPDMPIEEADEYRDAAMKRGLATVFLASPNTSATRLKRIIQSSSGFLYMVSVYGITGARSGFEGYTIDTLRSFKEATGSRLPVAVGFGISTPAHVKQMKAAGADAVIVGSAVVNLISRFSRNKKKLAASVRGFACSMKRACKK